MHSDPVMSGEELVTIVIPTYNRADDIDLGLTQLHQQSDQRFRVMVVDNSSTDNTVEIISRQQSTWGDRLSYMRKPPNGPASARNLGLQNSHTRYVLFMDSDITLHPDWIRYSLQILLHSSHISGLGGQVIYQFDHQRLNAFGGDIGYFGLAWDLHEGDKVIEQDVTEQRIWINCSAMIVDRQICQQSGGFDERFFYGFEDSDIGWKMNLQGHQLWVDSRLKAFHRVDPEPGPANPLITFHYCKNRLRSLLLNAENPSLWLKLLLYLGYSMADLVLHKHRMAKLKALMWNLKLLTETLSIRHSLQSRRKVPDQVIMQLGQQRWFPPTRLKGQRRRPSNGYQTNPENISLSRHDDRI